MPSAAGIASVARNMIKAAVTKNGLTPGGHQRTLRAGIVAVKLGMSAFWDHHGVRHGLTLLQVGMERYARAFSCQRIFFCAVKFILEYRPHCSPDIVSNG
jgi:hypothetical protein